MHNAQSTAMQCTFVCLNNHHTAPHHTGVTRFQHKYQYFREKKRCTRSHKMLYAGSIDRISSIHMLLCRCIIVSIYSTLSKMCNVLMSALRVFCCHFILGCCHRFFRFFSHFVCFCCCCSKMPSWQRVCHCHCHCPYGSSKCVINVVLQHIFVAHSRFHIGRHEQKTRGKMLHIALYFFIHRICK